MDSEATTKNQPPDIDIMAFQIRPGIAKGTSRRQKRCQPERWKLCVASSRSFCTLRIDWSMLKVMFQAWLVENAHTQASAAPITLPGNRFMKNTTVKVRKPRIGTDCRMSSSGISTTSARRLLAGSAAKTEGKRVWTDNAGEIP